MSDDNKSPKKHAKVAIREPPSKEEWIELDRSVIKGRLVMTEEQQDLLKEFKELVKDIKKPWHDDGELTRWLVARDWDLKKATYMFTESMKWRNKENIDTILDFLPKTNPFFDLLKEYWPHNILSPHRFYTKDGWPVIYEKFGALDFDLVDLMPLDHLVSFHMYTIECVEKERRRCVDLHGCPMGFTLVQDLEGLGIDHISPNAVKILKQIAKIDQDNFPEGLRKVFFVNTPKIFQMGWKLVKGAFDDGVVAKFNFFGDKEEFLPELLKVMTEDNIPVEYGGQAQVELAPGGSVKKYKKLAKEIRVTLKEEKAAEKEGREKEHRDKEHREKESKEKDSKDSKEKDSKDSKDSKEDSNDD